MKISKIIKNNLQNRLNVIRQDILEVIGIGQPVYLKVFNKEEKHNGFQYKTGYNKDTVPFNANKKDTCVRGGLYFSNRRNIHRFLSYGPYIRRVDVPKGAKMVPDESTKYRAEALFLRTRMELSKKETWDYLDSIGVPLNGNKLADKAWTISSLTPGGYEKAIELGGKLSDKELSRAISHAGGCLCGRNKDMTVEMLRVAIKHHGISCITDTIVEELMAVGAFDFLTELYHNYWIALPKKAKATIAQLIEIFKHDDELLAKAVEYYRLISVPQDVLNDLLNYFLFYGNRKGARIAVLLGGVVGEGDLELQSGNYNRLYKDLLQSINNHKNEK